MTGLDVFNQLSIEEAREMLLKTCGSSTWVENMIASRPFIKKTDLLIAAGNIWDDQCKVDDWLEAFSHHPKIGDLESLAKKYGDTKEWASGEQSGVDSATPTILKELAEGNQQYEEKFGFIFIVNATGKSASEMLTLLRERLNQDPQNEIDFAAREQIQITSLRLEKMLLELDKKVNP